MVTEPAPAERYRIQLLGGFAVRRAGRPLAVRPSTRRLVALLAVEGGMDRGAVAGRLFELSTNAQATGNLRTVLRRTRQDVPGLVAEDGRALWLDCDDVDFDLVTQWASHVVQAAPERQQLPPALGLELLPGWGEAWLIDHREHLALMQLCALEEYGASALAAGRFGEAARCALRAVAMDPLRESANKLLIEVVIRQGNHVEAVRRFRRYENVLAHETGTRPGLALQALMAPLVGASRSTPVREPGPIGSAALVRSEPRRTRQVL
jgi:DNA-binding SARP family transcriptional activator